jgi:hypothetical protein
LLLFDERRKRGRNGKEKGNNSQRFVETRGQSSAPVLSFSFSVRCCDMIGGAVTLCGGDCVLYWLRRRNDPVEALWVVPKVPTVPCKVVGMTAYFAKRTGVHHGMLPEPVGTPTRKRKNTAPDARNHTFR